MFDTKYSIPKVLMAGLAMTLFLMSCSSNADDERALVLHQNLTDAKNIMERSIATVVNDMKKHMSERKQLLPIYESGKSIAQKITPLRRFIQNLKHELIEASGGVWATEDKINYYKNEQHFQKVQLTTDAALNGTPRYTDNRRSPRKLLLGEGKADSLYALVRATREALLQVIDDLAALSEGENTRMKGVKFEKKDIEKLKEDLVLTPPDVALGKQIFQGVTLAEAIAILQKFEMDALDATSQLLNYLNANMSSRHLCGYERFDVFIVSKKPCILLGECYESEIALGAFYTQAEISVKVDGKALPVEYGVANYTVKPTTLGTQNYMVELSIVNPLTEEIEVIEKEFQFEVALPFQTVIADQMNVLFTGIDNEINIKSTTVKPEDIEVLATNGLKIRQIDNTRYYVNATQVTTMGTFSKIIARHRKTGKTLGVYPFRTKHLPLPRAVLTTHSPTGMVSPNEMKTQGGLMAVWENHDIDAKCQISSFMLYHTAPNQPIQKIFNKGGVFEAATLAVIQTANSGSVYQFHEIYGTCSGYDKPKKLNNLAIMVK